MRLSVMLILCVFAGLGPGCQLKPSHSHSHPVASLSKTIPSGRAFGALQKTAVLACSDEDDLIDALGSAGRQAGPVVDTLVADPGPNTAILWVHGMACPQCANNIDLQLLKVPGVQSVKVDMGSGKVFAKLSESSPPTGERLARAIEQTGFTLKKIQMP